MEELLVDYLKADLPLSVLVGNKINWNVRPQIDSVPSIVLTKVSADRSYVMAGSSGLVAARIQIDCWAITFAAAIEVARAVRDVLSGSKFSDSSVDVQGSFLDAERHFYEDEQAERFHRVSLDFIIWHSEVQ